MMGLFGRKWVTVRTESGSKADDMDRLHAIFKSNGLKSKVIMEGSHLKKVQVTAKDVERAKELIDVFEQES